MRLYTSRVAPAEDVDTTFFSTSADVLRSVPAAWRRQPSAAPSPILQWLLRTSAAAQTHAPASASTEAGPASTARAAPGGGSSSGAGAVESSAGGGSVTAMLARRGVARRDPLLDRLAKRASSVSDSATRGTATPAAAAAVVSTALGDVGASHWSRQRLSSVSAAGWAVLREQMGVELTAVNRRAAVSTEAPRERPPHASTPKLYVVDQVPPLRCWEEGGLPYALGRCVAAKYALPTAIQAQCVPLAMAAAPAHTDANVGTKLDIIGVAETGSGKTMAYIIPILAEVRMHRQPNLLMDEELKAYGPLAMVLVPTRELAEQVTGELHTLLGRGEADTDAAAATAVQQRERLHHWEAEELSALPSDEARVAHRRQHNLLSEVAVVKVVGGESEDAQYEQLSRGAHVVVGTIGQIRALLDRRLLALGNTRMVVVDEADRMIADHQQEDLIAVLARCPTPRQTLLFTATLSAECADIAKRYMSPAGYMLVRTPFRCTSIRQNFELVSLQSASSAASGESDDAQGDADASAASGAGKPSSRRKESTAEEDTREQREPGRQPSRREPGAARALSPLLHPEKFARLVAWLAYAGSGPIVVFAGEKRVCDALQDELAAEKAHLLAAEEYTTVEQLIGPAPHGLLFAEDEPSDPRGDAARQRRQRAESTAAEQARVQLLNLSSVAVVHSELSQAERRRLVSLFRDGQRRVLITTDLLARGLDVPALTLVVNYDMPWAAAGETPADAVARYVHRIGRTGRAGATGVAVSFVALPAELVQRARQATAHESSAARGTALPRKVYAPNTSDAVKQRDREFQELTHNNRDGRDVDAGELLGLARAGDGDDDDVDRADDYASDDDNGSDGGRPADDGDGPRARRRRRVESDGAPTAGPARKAFISDDAILSPLWELLCGCVAANTSDARASTRESAVMQLRRRWYAKIDLDPALSLIMAERAEASARLGTIRN